jgi:uncharacterized protein YbcV (DUF1398 family)
MIEDLQALHSAVKQLCYDRYYNPSDFTVFANALLSHGIVRYSFDLLDNEFYFYSKDTLLYRLALEEIDDASNDNDAFEFANALDSTKLQAVIQAFDAHTITLPEFHHELASLGVVYVCMYLELKKVYYMGQDAQYHLENYA